MAKETKRDYQTMNAKLAEIIEWFESDKVNLDEAIEKYEQALALIGEIEKYLKDTFDFVLFNTSEPLLDLTKIYKEDGQETVLINLDLNNWQGKKRLKLRNEFTCTIQEI